MTALATSPTLTPPRGGAGACPAPVEVLRREYRFATGDAWWDAIGRVPMDRVVFDPLPGTATVEDVVRLDDHEDTLCELVFGTLVRKQMGYSESLIGGNLFAVLHAFVRRHRLGLVAPADGMMRLLGRQVRIPDVSFVSRARLPGGRVPTDPVPDLVPDLAVEVISASNTPLEMQHKLREYFEAGTRLVWFVYPQPPRVEVYTAPDRVTTLSIGDTLGGGEVLPGFEVPLAELFDVA